jgi:hypothetical protein
MFEKKHNLFIFTDFLNVQVPIKFVYLPLSASASSIITSADKTEIEDVLKKIPGVKIIINTDADFKISNFTQGQYLPVCLLEVKWKSFPDYLSNLRSAYRRRYTQALTKGSKIKIDILKDNKEFTPEMYRLYEEVFNSSQYFLEKLTLDFFKNDISKIACLKVDNKVKAFVQFIEDRDTLIFEFGGYNHIDAHTYDLYHNMLLFLVKYGIENGFKYINFGQTAYDAKLKLGCSVHNKYFLLSSSNKIINYFMQKFIKFLQYKVKEYKFNVFNASL